jgi:predicted dithiol-disulfide oxidoreductase (DUF899 family)
MSDAHEALPTVVDRDTWQAERDALLAREKAHTHEGDAIAAARRRLPMVEVDPTVPLVGEHGPVPLLEVFEGRRQLIAYFHMWAEGRPAIEQCEGCTHYNGQVRELSYLHARDVTYATFCQGPYPESVRYRTTGRGWEAMSPSYRLLDMTVFGRQETWEDSPAGWPRHWGVDHDLLRVDGRPTAQWSRLAAGRSDDLGTAGTASPSGGRTS